MAERESKARGRNLATRSVAWLILGISLCACGCQPYLGTTSASFMRYANNSDPNLRYLAYEKLGSPKAYDSVADQVKAAQYLSERLYRVGEPVASRANICRSMGTLGRKESLPALRRAVDDPEPVVRAEAIRALGFIGEHQDEKTLARLAALDTQPECRIAALDALGQIKASDPDVLTMLLEAMGPQSDAAMRFASHEALVKSFGKDFGVEVEAWRKEIQKRNAATQTAASTKPGDVERR